MIIANIVALCILLLGSLNWFCVGVFSWKLINSHIWVRGFCENFICTSWTCGNLDAYSTLC